jgi:pSer/pThr/pTyr-binding forkhead associated (FHA) protein
VGRGPRADFVVDAALVSRVHCHLSTSDAGLAVEDLKSTNGTFVNDERIRKSALRVGDRLRLGRLELSVSEQRPRALLARTRRPYLDTARQTAWVVSQQVHDHPRHIVS